MHSFRLKLFSIIPPTHSFDTVMCVGFRVYYNKLFSKRRYLAEISYN
jgi:predicted aminopeptidase